MESSLKLGKIRGIEIGIHYSWLLVLALVTASLALGFFPQTFPALSPLASWLLGLVAALLLFVSVLIHELSHSLVAQSMGIRVRSIVLFIFGGVSSIEGEPRTARDEILVAIAGPLASIVLGVTFGALLLGLSGVSPELSALLTYLALTNLLLAAFNLIPGFPLDGGRVFRGLAWLATGSYARATNIATILGQAVAYIFIFGGLFMAFTGAFLSGIWIAFIGWFLNSAADAARRQSRLTTAFRGVRVRDLLKEEPPVTVPASLSLRDMVDEFVLQRNVRAVPVVDGQGDVVGIISIADIKKVPRERWDTATVAEAMTPADQMLALSPDDNAGEALQAMGQRDVAQVPVIDHGHLVGLLSRASILQFLHVREELGSRA
ncbi:MAG: site-2 protease family protein [Chloroflexi bacterium]|nr:site-2 protease family protein [Chloroflexota bacterium]MCL5111046.1 site-2 protease family protein [Chloroflexota bacterium]